MPLAEHDGANMAGSKSQYSFQFTCPSRSTTSHKICACGIPKVSIHVPLAEHDVRYCCSFNGIRVSIHVPLAEHDE